MSGVNAFAGLATLTLIVSFLWWHGLLATMLLVSVCTKYPLETIVVIVSILVAIRTFADQMKNEANVWFLVFCACVLGFIVIVDAVRALQ